RIWCIGHILNLACQAFLFTKDKDAVELAVQAAEELRQDKEHRRLRSEGALRKIHNITIWLRRSPSRYQKFIKLARCILPRDNNTR
ncbi:hypothetical protein K469DRAFT_600429, partial [Zopfia rhizophila CBS 207.26]